ncbi:MAG: NAD(P)/FAD-dependent oxidoreductase [Clostridiales bacterium]|nr:NAD(P)/FAD-dependent oxidoreductase [Clostridiales bacterium]
MNDLTSDIIIIGAGITGCAVARELSRYDASVTVLEAGSDVAEGATKANSGIIHAGFDALPGSRKAYHNVRGAALYPKLCEDLGVGYRRCGALVIALSEDERRTIEELYERGIANGVEGMRIIERDEILKLEPGINPEVVCALHATTSAIVSPYEVAFALADDAAYNGVQFLTDQRVVSVKRDTDHYTVTTTDSEYTCKILINCAGSFGADIHNQISDNKLSMVHRRGQYYLLDRAEKLQFGRTIFQCPSKMGKGVLISPTLHGNLIIGPTAEDIDDPEDTATTADGLADIIAKARRTWPQLSVRTNITNFSGIRAHLTTGDFVIGRLDDVREASDAPKAYEAIGIESPGLSAAPSIAKEICQLVLKDAALTEKKDIKKYTRQGKSFHDMSAEERAEAVKRDPRYGNIICRCETVTEAEIRDAIRRPVGARSIDAVKRRTRAGMGRCQGGFCSPRVAAIISEETGIPLTEVTKNGGRSYLLTGTVEEYLKGGESDDRS